MLLTHPLLQISDLLRLEPFGVSKFVYSGRSAKPDDVAKGAVYVTFEVGIVVFNIPIYIMLLKK